jgi:hypothetical protein
LRKQTISIIWDLVGKMLLHLSRLNLKQKTGNIFTFPGGLFLAVVFFSGCQNTENNVPQMAHSNIQLTATFPHWRSNKSDAQVVLTFSNPTDHTETVVLPCPLNEHATSFSSPEKPTLILAPKIPFTQDEDSAAFVLTDWGKDSSAQAKKLTLKPGESVQVPYALTSFYFWGHGGPVESESFLDCLQPGEREIEVFAVILYSDDREKEPLKGPHIKSPNVLLKCSFPDWLFKKKDDLTARPKPNLSASEQKELDEAFKAVESGAGPEALYRLGVALFKFNRVDEAIEYFNMALELTPNNADVHYQLGLALESKGSISDAISSFRKALAIKPDFPAARQHLDMNLVRVQK